MIGPLPLSSLAERAAEVAATITDSGQRALFQSVMSRVDQKAHAALQDKYRAAVAASDPGYVYKYLDLPFWIKDKVVKVFAMGLAARPATRILDLGTGAGHFLAVCDVLGFEGIGLDIELPFYVDLCALMGVDRRTCRVNPGEPLPDLGRFDLVTAFQIKFDALGADDRGRYLYWSLADWDFFIRDVTCNVVRYPGTLRLELNSRVLADGTKEKFLDVLDAFRGAGAEVNEVSSYATFQVERPISLPQTAAPSTLDPQPKAGV